MPLVQNLTSIPASQRLFTLSPPKHYYQLSQGADAALFISAYNRELTEIEEVGGYRVVPCRPNVRPLPLLELFSTKVDNISGNIIPKVRIVATGDLTESTEPTAAPVAGNENPSNVLSLLNVSCV